MKFFLPLFLIFSFSLAQTTESPDRISEEERQSVQRVESVILELQTNPGATHRVADKDLNAYLKSRLQESKPAGLQDLLVAFGQGTLVTQLKVDLDQVDKGQLPLSMLLFGALLSGEQVLELEGELSAADSKGQYVLKKASLNGTDIPVPLATLLLQKVGASVEPPFDPTEPFQLGWGIREITLQKGLAVIKS